MVKNILITGNLGYVGAGLIEHLRRRFPTANIDGMDAGFFAACLTNPSVVPERLLNRQHYCDVRDVRTEMLRGVDAVIHLAAISNDPMGKAFEEQTEAINEKATRDLATAAKQAGVKTFVFASSCSVYGFAEEGARDERSAVNPLTAYARSKVNSEKALQSLADESFQATCLRFATACGFSSRLRLDLVLNDFVAAALVSGQIQILSDGSPWRPLIDVQDMARAFEWAISRPQSNGGPFLIVNAGSDRWNYRVKSLAEAVAGEIPATRIHINESAQPDKRSYKVDFSLFRRLAPDHQPLCELSTSIQRLRSGLTEMHFQDADFRNSHFMRLNMLSRLRESGNLSKDLRWQQNSSAAEGRSAS